MKLLASLKLRWVAWVWKHTPDCKEMSRLSSLAFEQPPGFTLRLRMWLHHLICVWCRRYERQLKFLRRVAPRLEQEVETASSRGLSVEARRRIVERLHEEC